MKRLPKEDYDKMVGACDVGMIFLDHRFTIPNFSSRFLSYMQAKIPVFAVTDPNTDIGKFLVDNEIGWWCESNNVKTFNKIISNITSYDYRIFVEKEEKVLIDNFSSDKSCHIILNHFIWGEKI